MAEHPYISVRNGVVWLDDSVAYLTGDELCALCPRWQELLMAATRVANAQRAGRPCLGATAPGRRELAAPQRDRRNSEFLYAPARTREAYCPDCHDYSDAEVA